MIKVFFILLSAGRDLAVRGYYDNPPQSDAFPVNISLRWSCLAPIFVAGGAQPSQLLPLIIPNNSNKRESFFAAVTMLRYLNTRLKEGWGGVSMLCSMLCLEEVGGVDMVKRSRERETDKMFLPPLGSCLIICIKCAINVFVEEIVRFFLLST